MPRTRTLLTCLLLLLMALTATAKERKEKPRQLAKRIDAVLAAPDVARGAWGVKIVDEATGRVLYERGAEMLFAPASNTKLYTTAAAFALIGPQYVYRTTVETPGTVDSRGRVSSDLVLVGRGDPNLSGRTLPYAGRTERPGQPAQYLQQLADAVVARGVKVIDGDIVGDDSYYVWERYGEGWSQDDLMWESGAAASALSLNDNLLYVKIAPGDRAGDRAFLTLEPFTDYYEIDNQLVTTAAKSGPRRLGLNRELDSRRITVWGTIPQDDAGTTELLTLEDPALYSAQMLRQMLEQRGVVVLGKTRTRHAERTVLPLAGDAASPVATSSQPTPPPMAVLAEHVSGPLADDLKVINKVSQNLHAELTLRLLGRHRGNSGSLEGGLAVMRQWLATAGIAPEEYAFYDGSGMSRQNLTSPAATVKLLQFAHSQSWGAQYEDTLPVGGADGTLAHRFTDPRLAARVHAKTGSMGHVNALSGYLTTLPGRRVVFSIMTNNHLLGTRNANGVIDTIVQAVLEDGGR